MGNSYHRSYSIIFIVLLSFGDCSKDNVLKFERHPEGVDYDDSYSIKVTRGQEVISSTLTRGGHYRAITVTVSAFNAVFVLDLHLNRHLFAVGYVERSFSKEGVVYHDVNHTENHCYYLGKVRDQPQSTAAVSTCKGIVGYFTIGNISYHIDPASNQLRGPHKVYRSRDDAKTIYRCGHESVSLNSLLNSGTHRGRGCSGKIRGEYTLPVTFPKKSELKRFIWPQDLDKKNKVVELFVANDYSQYRAKGSDVNVVIQRAKNIVNIASAGYQPLGIYIVLVGVEVWNMGDNITINTADPNSTLNKWADYRMTYINPYHYNDNGILITNNTFGSIIGLAFLGGMCKNRNSAAFVGDVYPLPYVAGSVMDHEMGHNFGLIHDTDVSPCVCSDPNGKCIMYPEVSSATPSFTWSQCSKDTLMHSFEHGLDICLYNDPQTIEPNNTPCGNGVVENGEQCDCGNSTDQECNKACCNPTTCQLVSPATCAYGRCCNISTCQLLSCGILCRGKADSSCDLDEFCDGLNHLCSNNTHLPDGANCTVNGNGAYCYNGRCRSRESQCELLWGPGTLVSIDLCYNENQNGDVYGNCGINWLPNVNYVQCASSDVMCGTLQCKDFSRNLSYYEQYYMIGEKYFTDGVTNETCHTVIFDFGLDTQDPGFVPSGASCGPGKMCVNQRCLNVSSLNTIPCSSSCQTNEVCNNVGQCQSTVGTCQQSTTATSLTTQQAPTTTAPIPNTTTLTPTTSTPTVITSTPMPTTSTPTPTTSTPTSTESTITLTTSTPTTTKTSLIPTTSTPTSTTSTITLTTNTPTTTKTSLIPTTSTPTATESTITLTTSTPTTTKTSLIPTTSTPTSTTSTITLTTNTPTTTKTSLIPTTSTPTSTTSTITLTTNTPTTTKTYLIPTTSTPTSTTSTITLTTSTPTTTKTSLTPTTSTPISNISTTLATSTQTTTKESLAPTTSTPISTTSTPTTIKTSITPITSVQASNNTTPNPATSTLTPTTSTLTATKPTRTPTISTPTPTTSTPMANTGTPTSSANEPKPTMTISILTESTSKSVKSSPVTTPDTPTATINTSISTTPVLFPNVPNSTTSMPASSVSTPSPITSTMTPSTGTPEATTTQAPVTTLVLGLVLGALALITAAVFPPFCCYMFCPGAFAACCQLFTGVGPTAVGLPLGSVPTPVFTTGVMLPVQPRLRWIPAEGCYLPQRHICTQVQPQTENLQPDWSLLRQPRQPFGKGYQYPNASYTDFQPYSSRNNMKIPQIVIG